MHLTLKKEATTPQAANFLQQQAFDDFIESSTTIVLTRGLDMKCPAEVYRPSPRLSGPAGPHYPFHDNTVQVTRCGRICLGKRN